MPRAPTGRATTAETSRAHPTAFAQELFRGLPARYDLLAEVLSFGQNRRWRRAMVDHVVPGAPDLVLDVATGTAGVALQLARRTPGRIVGLDISEPMLGRGRDNVTAAGAAGRVHLLAGRAEELPFPDEVFDALTFTYLLRYVADPAETLSELARVVKPGGPVASLEFHVPPHPFWRFWWWLYTRAVLPLGGVLGGRAWVSVGRFLGPNISEHYRRYPLAWTLDAWRAASFVGVEASVMSLGGGVVIRGRKGG